MDSKKILVLGVTGMLGHAIFKHFMNVGGYDVYGTVRFKSGNLGNFFSEKELAHIIEGVDADNFDSFIRAFGIVKPDIVINCIGIIKHLPEAKNYYKSINVNSFLPHRLAQLCYIANARFIHVSTDCVFDGKRGNYKEYDNSNAEDLYGKSKYLGEVDYPHAVTIRTSIIGHELSSDISLIDWFLSQNTAVNGYTNAIYTGFPTYEIANIIQEYIIPNPQLHGLYHVSSDPISKYDLLNLVAEMYNKKIDINPFSGFVLDRALDSTRFRNELNFTPKPWSELVKLMKNKFLEYNCYKNKHLRIGK